MPLFDSRLIAFFTAVFFLSAAFLADGASSLPH